MENHDEFDIAVDGIIYQAKMIGQVEHSKCYRITLNKEIVTEIYFNGKVWVGVTDSYNKDMAAAFGSAIQEKLIVK